MYLFCVWSEKNRLPGLPYSVTCFIVHSAIHEHDGCTDRHISTANTALCIGDTLHCAVKINLVTVIAADVVKNSVT